MTGAYSVRVSAVSPPQESKHVLDRSALHTSAKMDGSSGVVSPSRVETDADHERHERVKLKFTKAAELLRRGAGPAVATGMTSPQGGAIGSRTKEVQVRRPFVASCARPACGGREGRSYVERLRRAGVGTPHAPVLERREVLQLAHRIPFLFWPVEVAAAAALRLVAGGGPGVVVRADRTASGKFFSLLQVAFQKYRIVEVDCNKSCFTAIVTLHLRWQDFSIGEKEFEDNKAWQTSWRPRWTPNLDFVNETGA